LSNNLDLDQKNNTDKIVIDKAIRIISVLNKHLNGELNCQHKIRDILKEAFLENEN